MALHHGILLALILAIPAGVFLPEFSRSVAFLGTVFLQALKMLVGPLILTSVVVGIAGLREAGRTGPLGLKTLAYYTGTTALAILLGLALVNLIRPGLGVSLAGSGTPAALVQATPDAAGFLRQLLLGLFENPVAALANGRVLPLIAFALLLGGALAALGERARPVLSVVASLNDAVLKMVHWVLYAAPAGVFGLVASLVAAQGLEVFRAVAAYAATVLLGLGIHAGALLLILRTLGGLPVAVFLRGVREALLLAFSTSSSSATLPVTLAGVTEKLRVPPRVAGFVLPLGATLNMDGTALYEAVAALFIAQAYGIHLNLAQQGMVFLTAMAAAVGAAGIPSAGLVTMALVLHAVGLPLEGIGLILAVDRVLDMGRTTVNVLGDAVGSVVLAATEQAAEVEEVPAVAKERA